MSEKKNTPPTAACTAEPVAVCPTCGFKGARYWAPDKDGVSRLYCRHSCAPLAAKWARELQTALDDERRIIEQWRKDKASDKEA
jgi:hypothetical protein